MRHHSVLDDPIPLGSLESVHVLSTLFSQTSLQSTQSTPPLVDSHPDKPLAAHHSPVKFKQQSGPRKQPIEAALRWFPPPTATLSRAKRGRTIEFKLGVLSWAHHILVDDSRGGKRPPTREEVRQQFGLKHINQISKWRRDEALFLKACAKTQRIRHSNPRWKELERVLILKFAERRNAGCVVRRGWFERTAKQLFKEIYPESSVKFRFSQGWFARCLHRNAITLRIITNKAQETPEEYCEMIISFLCFNRRNSQLRDGTEDMIRGVLIVGRFLLSNILNMDQTPLPWEYLAGKTYDFKGKKTIWVKSRKSGWDKRQATIQLTIFADGIARVKPLLIFRGAAVSNSTSRWREVLRYDPRVVVKFNNKAYATSEIIIFWLQELLLPVKPGRFTGGNRTQAVTSSNSTQRIVTCVVAVTF